MSGVATDCTSVECTKTKEEVDVMAERVSGQEWYHRHCMDISSEVFGPDDVPWDRGVATVGPGRA